ncbi:hypothetical protein CBR_g29687 [Chara braunii]|uniref:t-SNARE coiled-coil homology domain-containing protein n=1 Tax=Chara braunii TaxID=69332 RepID=A0A388LB48_CHABU|nr:hypothetical protein CBR_g29687 [Chara braunii]|eukprot:GBG79540.1 hypothetical protein CBR_g29687 [Chara braunii]
MTASVRDRTGLFRQIVREVALRKGFDQLNNVRMLEGFIAQNKRNYLDCFRSTEAERDDIEHQAELSSLADSVKETESKLLEVSALGHLFSTHVLQQAQQIERLYKDAVEATHNVDMGNKEIVKTISRNSTSRVFLLLFFMVLIFTILFLDWYK